CERRGGGDGADHDIGSAERLGEGGQDRGLRGKGQSDHVEREVAAQRQHVAAQVLLDEIVVVAVGGGKGHRSSLSERIREPSRRSVDRALLERGGPGGQGRRARTSASMASRAVPSSSTGRRTRSAFSIVRPAISRTMSSGVNSTSG